MLVEGYIKGHNCTYILPHITNTSINHHTYKYIKKTTLPYFKNGNTCSKKLSYHEGNDTRNDQKVFIIHRH